jgi:hypothetical protein
VSRRAFAVFAVVYPAFDAAVGVASGVLVQAIASDHVSAIEPALQALFWGPVTGSLALVGGAARVVAMCSAALAFRRAGAPAVVYGLLAVSGLLLGVGHARPLGPLAALAFLVAAARIELGPRAARPPLGNRA